MNSMNIHVSYQVSYSVASQKHCMKCSARGITLVFCFKTDHYSEGENYTMFDWKYFLFN